MNEAGIRPYAPSLGGVDVVRFLAAMAIVGYHYAGHFGYETSILHPWELGLVKFVDLFFILSGFVIATFYFGRIGSLRAYGDFLLKRAARLLPLHWATLAFFVTFAAAAAALGVAVNNPARYDPSCLPANIALLHSMGICDGLTYNYVSWSISAEMVCYIAFPVLALGLARWPRVFAALTIAALLALFAFAPGWMKSTFEAGWLRALPSFCVGMVLYRLRAAGTFPTFAPWHLAAAVLLVAVTCHPAIADEVGYIALVLCVIIATGVGDERLWGGRLNPGFLGSLTYSIYMLHPIVILVSITLLGRLVLGLDRQGQILLALGSWWLIIPVATLSLRYFETPARRSISALGKARDKVPGPVSP